MHNSRRFYCMKSKSKNGTTYRIRCPSFEDLIIRFGKDFEVFIDGEPFSDEVGFRFNSKVRTVLEVAKYMNEKHYATPFTCFKMSTLMFGLLARVAFNWSMYKNRNKPLKE